MTQVKPVINSVWGSTGATTDPGTTKMNLGWTAEIPTHNVQNFWQQRTDEMLTHLNEQGIAEWDSATTYPVAAWAKGSDGEVYRALQVATAQDPVSAPAFWTLSLGSSGAQVVAIGSNANGHFKIWSDGEIEQWGVDLSPDYAGKTLSLPVTFPTTGLGTAYFQQRDTAVLHLYPIILSAATSTTISYRSNNSNTATDLVYWSARGR